MLLIDPCWLQLAHIELLREAHCCFSLIHTYLGWDQMTKLLHKISPSEVAQFDNICLVWVAIVGLGLPVIPKSGGWPDHISWSSLMNITKSTEEIVTTACVKLCKSHDFIPALPSHTIAVMSQRFGLDFAFGHPDVVLYQQKAVASHLLICQETIQDRLWQYMLYPLEPLLACSGTWLMHQHPSYMCIALGCLQDKISGGLIDMGQKGELTSQVVLLITKDQYLLL